MGKTVKIIIGVVLIAAAIYFAPEIAPFLTHLGLGISAAVATSIATAVVSTAIGIGIGLITQGLGIGSAGTPKADQQIGPPQVFRQSIANSFIVYGKRRVGGLLVFFHSAVSGANHFRYFVIAVAGHRCQGVVQWMLNDEAVSVDGSGKVTSGTYANAAWLWFQRGLASETANATFVSECGGNWTSNHKGDGVAAIYAKFQLTDAVVQAGMPNITAVIEGRDEILDPRTATTGYTRNSSLIFYDWMALAREEGGFGSYADEIPDDTWISAQANVCDEAVNGNARYACDAVLTTGAPPGEVRDAFVVNCAGSYTYSGGKHLMRPGYWNPVSGDTLSESDLAGPLQLTPFMTSDVAATQVLGTYISPADGYQGMPFTTWTRPGTTDLRQANLDLAFVTVKDQADRIAAIMGKRAACDKQVVWPMNIVGVKVRALDTKQVDAVRYGLNNYAWVVTSFGLSFDPSVGPGVVLGLREENSEIYDDGTPVTPSTPGTIVQPSGPLLTQAQTTSLIAGSSVPDLTFSVDTSGVFDIGDHHRDYADKTVAVTGNASFATGASTGDVVLVYYDDPARAGGAVTYQHLIITAAALAAGTGDTSSAYPSPTNPYRHFVCSGAVPASGTHSGGSFAGGGGGATGPGGYVINY